MSNELNSPGTDTPAGAALPASGAGGDAGLPEHLIRLPPSSEWALWRQVCVRGAGFPAGLVRELSAPECGASADRHLQAEQELRRARAAAIDALWAELKKAGEAEVPLIRKAIRRLEKDKPPTLPESCAAAAAAVKELERARAEAEAAGEEFRHSFARAVRGTSEKIRELSGLPRFREAVIWQNRHAYRTGVLPLAQGRPAPTRDTKQRQREELVATYLQRYCVKNDTIGFFGPVGWGKFTSRPGTVCARPGESLLDSRRVYFESWGIEALCDTLNRGGQLRPWVAPRLMPYVYLNGTTLHLPFTGPSQLSVQQASVLHACDGRRTAKQIAALVTRLPAAGLGGEADVFALLSRLGDRGLLSWAIEVPVGTHPEQALRRQLERVEDERLRDAALRALDELEAGRRAVAAAAGDPEKLDQALSDFDEIFARLTDAAPTRGAGKTYAGRTLVYEDCRRDIEVELGQDLLDALGPVLSLLLTSARWLTHTLAETYRKLFAELHREMARESGSATVDGYSFWQRAMPYLFEKTTSHAINRVLQERWAAILDVPPGQRRVSYSSRELSPLVRAAFEAPRAGWQAGRSHSPDVMIGAASLEALRRGDYSLTLGEMHTASNTLGAALFVEQHPRPDELRRAIDAERPEPRVVPVPPKSWPSLTTRTSPQLVSPVDWRLTISPDAVGVEAARRALPVGTLMVENVDGRLEIRTRDGSLRFELIEFMGEVIGLHLVDSFRLLPPGGYTPRVTIDRVVVCRESWSFAPCELEFASEKGDAARYLAARRWASALGLPRRVFVKVSTEVKPFYVDLDSPLYVDIFSKLVRAAARSESPGRVSVTEMLPDADHAWLPDADGRRYASEIRIVARDLIE